MKSNDFIKNLSTKMNVTQAKGGEIFRTVLDSIFEAVESDGSLRTTYGTFVLGTTAARPEREGHNPKTMEKITIPATPARKKVSFKMSKNYKEELNG